MTFKIFYWLLAPLAVIRTCVLLLVVLPSVRLSGPSQPIREGDSVNLTCNVTAGFPSPQLCWSKNGDDLKENNAVLFLKEVTDKDEGSYTCEARNSGGSSVDHVQVNVQGKFIFQASKTCCRYVEAANLYKYVKEIASFAAVA